MFLSAVEDDLKTVEELNLPLCLVHGDLQAVNIVKRADGGCTFFDFEGAIVSYPLLDALDFLFICKQYEEVLFEDISFYFELWGVAVPKMDVSKSFAAMQRTGMFMGFFFFEIRKLERCRGGDQKVRL